MKISGFQVGIGTSTSLALFVGIKYLMRVKPLAQSLAHAVSVQHMVVIIFNLSGSKIEHFV